MHAWYPGFETRRRADRPVRAHRGLRRGSGARHVQEAAAYWDALPKHQARLQQGAADLWGARNHTGDERIKELRDQLVITEVDQKLLLHVGVERSKHWIEVERWALAARASCTARARRGGVERRW